MAIVFGNTLVTTNTKPVVVGGRRYPDSLGMGNRSKVSQGNRVLSERVPGRDNPSDKDVAQGNRGEVRPVRPGSFRAALDKPEKLEDLSFGKRASRDAIAKIVEGISSGTSDDINLPPVNPKMSLAERWASKKSEESTRNTQPARVSREAIPLVSADRILARFVHLLKLPSRYAGAPFLPVQEDTHKQQINALRVSMVQSMEQLSAQDPILTDPRLRLDISSKLIWEPRVSSIQLEDGSPGFVLQALLELRNQDGENLQFFQDTREDFQWRAVPEGAVMFRMQRVYRQDGEPLSRPEVMVMYAEQAFASEVREMEESFRDPSSFENPNGGFHLKVLLEVAAAKGFQRPELASDPEFLSELSFIPRSHNLDLVLAKLAKDPHVLDYSPPMRAFYFASHPDFGQTPVVVELSPADGCARFAQGKAAEPSLWKGPVA